jgi:hypothetical protein
MFQNQSTMTNQTIPPLPPIDTKPIIEHGESPTAIILAIAILISIVVGSITELARAILIAILRQTKPPY